MQGITIVVPGRNQHLLTYEYTLYLTQIQGYLGTFNNFNSAIYTSI